jgi:hypothetical protein
VRTHVVLFRAMAWLGILAAAAGVRGEDAKKGDATKDEAKKIDAALAAWARHAQSMKLVDCEFARWEYAPWPGIADAKGQLQAHAISWGKIAIRPKGTWEFEVVEFRDFNRVTGKYDKARRADEHWMFDGRDLWEISTARKSITQLPAGAAFFGIRFDSFFAPIRLALLGDKADAVRRAYDVRDVTAAQFAANEVWLQLTPRDAEARRLYSNFDLVLKLPDMLPHAIRMVSAGGGSVSVLEFRKLKYNNVFAPAIKRPGPPEGWKVNLIVEVQHKSEQADRAKPIAVVSPPAAASPPAVETQPRRRRWFGIGRRLFGRR